MLAHSRGSDSLFEGGGGGFGGGRVGAYCMAVGAIFNVVLCDRVVLLQILSLSRWPALAVVNMMWHQPAYYA